MARYAKPRFRKMPKRSYTALKEASSDTTDKAFESLQEQKAPVLTSKDWLREMVKEFEDKYGIKVVISRKPFKDHPKADALMDFTNNVIYLHPILRYYHPHYVWDVLEHEGDHLKVGRRYGWVEE